MAALILLSIVALTCGAAAQEKSDFAKPYLVFVVPDCDDSQYYDCADNANCYNMMIMANGTATLRGDLVSGVVTGEWNYKTGTGSGTVLVNMANDNTVVNVIMDLDEGYPSRELRSNKVFITTKKGQTLPQELAKTQMCKPNKQGDQWCVFRCAMVSEP